MRMNEVARLNSSIRSYVIVAMAFLFIGIGIGVNIGGNETSTYTPPVITTPTAIREFNPTWAIIAGAVGAAVVLMVGGYVLMRAQNM